MYIYDVKASSSRKCRSNHDTRQPIQNRSPDLGTNYLKIEWIAPKVRLQF